MARVEIIPDGAVTSVLVYLFDNAELQFKIHPETLQEAAAILRSELLRKGEWYNAFLASIKSVLKPNEHYARNGEFNIHAGFGANDLAKDILNQIIGTGEQ